MKPWDDFEAYLFARLAACEPCPRCTRDREEGQRQINRMQEQRATTLNAERLMARYPGKAR